MLKPMKLSAITFTKSFFIATDIIHILLLLEKHSIKETKVSIDFQNDIISIFDKKS